MDNLHEDLIDLLADMQSCPDAKSCRHLVKELMLKHRINNFTELLNSAEEIANNP